MATGDLVILVADLDTEITIKTLLSKRCQSFSIRPVQFEVIRHPQRDSGCLNDAHNLLKPYAKDYAKALVIFDHHGSGREKDSTDALEEEVARRLSRHHWADEDVAVVVIEPELEAWVWTDSPHVSQVLGWGTDFFALRRWVQQHSTYWGEEDAPKPQHPKEAFRAALRARRVQASASLFQQLAEHVSWRSCQDRSFLKLAQALSSWFPGA